MTINKRVQTREEQSRRGALVGLTTSLAFLLVVCLLRFTATQAQSCDYSIGAGVSTADGNSNYSGVQPGDVVCVNAGARRPLTLLNFQGTADQPITFINSGGQVDVDAGGDWCGIWLRNCDHVRLTGTGDPATEYGFEIYNSSNMGVYGSERSRYLELDHIEVHDVENSGIGSQTQEPLRGKWIQYGPFMHHCYIHDVGTEGYYFGSSRYDEGEMPTLEGVEIAYNIIERTGWDGGQIGSCVRDCSIHHNRIYQDSRKNEQYQRSGIMINRGSVCDVHSNFIEESGSTGIYIQGNGGNKIYNNIIVNPGEFAEPGGNNAGDGIDIDVGSNLGNSIYAWNNTIISPNNFGVKISNRAVGDDNRIQNNIVVDPGNLGAYGDAAYIQTWGIANVTVSNNLQTPDISTLEFTDYQNDDYSLQSNSPAIDAGVDLSWQGVVDDYDGSPRPQGPGYDIGAYEYASGSQPTRSSTSTPTTIPTSTPTASPTSTPTSTSTSTSTPSASPASTSTSTSTSTPTVGPTSAPTATPTSTPAIVPTMTATPTPNPNEVIIDDGDAAFSTSFGQDSWEEYTQAGGRHYGGSHHYNHQVDTGQDIALWSFAVPKPGRYEVYAWWWEASWRPTDVPYAINHLGGSTTIRVDQQTSGGQWNLLGAFDFQGQGSVVVSDDVSSGQDIVADAVRLVYVEPLPPAPPTSTATAAPTSTATIVPTMTATPTANPDEVIIDNIDGGFSASFSQDAWVEYTQPGGRHYGGSHYYNHQAGTGQDIAAWSFTVPKPGRYKVYAWWWEGRWRPRDVPYTISHLDGSTTVRVNQRVKGGRWNLLGAFDFVDRGSVAVSDDVSSGHDVVADAVRVVYQGPPRPGGRYRGFMPIIRQ